MKLYLKQKMVSIMSKAQNTHPCSFALSIRSTNPKAITLVKAISKNDCNAIQNIINNTPTKIEKAQIFQSTFIQEMGSTNITPNENALYELAKKMNQTWTITKIMDFASAAGIGSTKLPDYSLINTHNCEPSSIDLLIKEVNQFLIGDCSSEVIAA